MYNMKIKPIILAIALLSATPSQSAFDVKTKNGEFVSLEESVATVKSQISGGANRVLSQYDVQLDPSVASNYSDPFLRVIRINPNKIEYGETIKSTLIHEVAHGVFGPYYPISIFDWVDKNFPIINIVGVKGLLSHEEKIGFKKDYEMYMNDPSLSKQEINDRNLLKLRLLEYGENERAVESFGMIAQMIYSGGNFPKYIVSNFEKLFRNVPNKN